MSLSSRARRLEDASRARQIQTKAGIYGAARTTAIGTGLGIIAHYYWPRFRRQTPAFKGFLFMGCKSGQSQLFLSIADTRLVGMVGLVFGAENALIEYETHRRLEENALRKQARIELTREGIVPSETEIARWRLARNL
ncbi:hypothetical protein C8J56DRAFT_557053 [Mycena floridula]|nr:hypothetical protein C8J56DRAFT_557053 [Mycena floridula]